MTAAKFPRGLNATSKASRSGLTSQPTPSTYSLRIEYAPDSSGDLPISDRDLVPNWSREFAVSGNTTLEQLSEVILDILDWDSLHLYEFRIRNHVYAHMVFLSEDDLFVDAQNPCVSCDIPIRLLGLAASDTFAYIFDYGDYHTFRITVLDVRSADMQSTPTLLAHTGRNIIQYPGTLPKAAARAFENRLPSVKRPELRQLIPNENRTLDILQSLTGDRGLKRDRQARKGKFIIGDDPVLAGLDHADALIAIAIGLPNAALCRRFLIDPRRAAVLRELVVGKYAKLFE